jgi:branched-chain amino acid transport system permease protein
VRLLQYAISGLIYGGAYAMLGVCLVVMFRMVRVLNFAQAAIGAFGAYVAVELSGQGWAFAPVAIVGALAAGALAALCGAVMARWFADANTERRSTVAIAMFIAILTIGFRVFGTNPKQFPQLLPNSTIHIAGVVITVASVLLVVLTVGVAVGVALFLKRTRLGIRLRAQSERPRTAELLGVPSRWMTVGVWALTGVLASLGTLIVAPSRAADFLSLGTLIIPGLAAAAVGLFRSTGLAVVGGIALGLAEGLLQEWGSLKEYSDAVPLVLIVIMLVWSQRSQVWDAAR